MGATDRTAHAVKARARSHAPARRGRPVQSFRPPSAHVAAAVALAAALTLAGAIAVFSLISLVAQHSEHLEALWWLAAFGLVTPIALLLSERLLAATTTPPGRQALNAAAPCALLALGAALFLARACGSLVALPRRCCSCSSCRSPSSPCNRGYRRSRRAATRAGRRRSRSVRRRSWAFWPSCQARRAIPPSSSGRPSCSRSRPESGGSSAGARSIRARASRSPCSYPWCWRCWRGTSRSRRSEPQDFYLGPANDIRHGRYMLVDDYSQYGVAVIYFVAPPWPSCRSATAASCSSWASSRRSLILTVYTVLRVATRSAAFACAGTFVGLMASTIATLGHSTSFPSSGSCASASPGCSCARSSWRTAATGRRGPLLAAYALVGIAAVWSFETAFYTLARSPSCVVAVASLEPPRERMRHALRQLGAGAAAALLADRRPRRRRRRSGAAGSRTSAAISTSSASTR